MYTLGQIRAQLKELTDKAEALREEIQYHFLFEVLRGDPQEVVITQSLIALVSLLSQVEAMGELVRGTTDDFDCSHTNTQCKCPLCGECLTMQDNHRC